MSYTEKHEPGSFSWVELATTDQAAAEAFYSRLFGWITEDRPMGPDAVYTIFRLEGQVAAGGYGLGPQDRGTRPHWNLYITVESADAAVQRARELGATIVEGAFDVSDVGRMAVIKDPTGAYFAVWQPKQQQGIGVQEQSGSFCWADLNTPATAKAARFYSGLFGWTFVPGESAYLHIRNGEKFIGGLPPAGDLNPSAPPHWLVYFQVDDCDASTRKVRELGGRILRGPLRMENVGAITVAADPQGAVFTLFQPK